MLPLSEGATADRIIIIFDRVGVLGDVIIHTKFEVNRYNDGFKFHV